MPALLRLLSSTLAVALLAFPSVARAQLSEVRIFITGESIPVGQTRTYSVADRICIGFPLSVTVRGGDSVGTPITVCAVSAGAGIGITNTQSGPKGFTFLPEGTRLDPESGVITRPPGWVAPKVTRVEPPARGTPHSSVVAADYVGRWRGRISEPNGQFKSYSLEVTIAPGEAQGTLFGEARYGSYECTASWTAFADAESPAGALTLYERILDEGLGCGAGTITLTPQRPGVLGYTWSDSGSPSQARGVLTRLPQ